MKEQLITLTGQDVDKMSGNDVRRELLAQEYFLNEMQKIAERTERKAEKHDTPAWHDKALLFRNYITAHSGFVAVLERAAKKRMDDYDERARSSWQAYNRRQRQRKERDKASAVERVRKRDMLKQINSEGITLAWDIDKFKLIARDRGYQTDEAIIYAIGQEVGLDRIRAKTLYETGRFTWGQVMCLGAMFEMTPKEFCDTFLSGYFVDTYGDYRACYDNIDKKELLKPPVRQYQISHERKEKEEAKRKKEEEARKKMLEALESMPDPEIIEVNSDGSPIDEEWWDG